MTKIKAYDRNRRLAPAWSLTAIAIILLALWAIGMACLYGVIWLLEYYLLNQHR